MATIYPAIVVTIDSTDRTSNIDKKSLKIQDKLTSEINTCTFKLFDYDNNIVPTYGESVSITYQATALDSPETIFAGEISYITQEDTAPGAISYEYMVTCADLSKKLKNKLAIQVYEDELAGDIIKDLIDTYFSGVFTYVNVQDGINIGYIAFNYQDVFKCISQLADLIGFDWYVDYAGDIHFFSEETNLAPYSLTESLATTGNYKNLKIKVDKSQLRNAIYVIGGTYLSDTVSSEYRGTGIETSWILPYPPRSPITVYVDDTGAGSNYVAKTLGIDNVDTTGYDFVVNYEEKAIKSLDYGALPNSYQIKITYKYDIQILTYDEDEDSINTMIAIEGGDGIYEHKIVDSKIQTIDSAHSRALSELEQYANAIINGRFQTDQYGYQSGQLLTINMPNRGYNNQTYLIQSVTKQLDDDNRFKYNVQFATKLKGLTEFLAELFEQGQEVVVNENVTLHDLTKPAREFITLVEDATNLIEGTSPFYWSNDAGTTPGKGIWGEAQWA